VVFSKVNPAELYQLFLQVNPLWLIIAIVFFNLSKIVSSFRLQEYFSLAGVNLSQKENLKLYYIGMFYNLFLPGGIGGDVYKVYILNKGGEGSIKDLISASLIDRLSGLVALLFLALILISTFFHQYFEPLLEGYILIIGGIILAFPAFYLLLQLFFKTFKKSFLKTNLLSIGVQGLQLICAYFILISLGVEDQYMEYLAVFLFSSIVAILPFTLGGVGARELVFLFAADHFSIQQNQAITFSIIFFIITAASSFIGLFLEQKSKVASEVNPA
jgi:glycosyltransferase 2 family protein